MLEEDGFLNSLPLLERKKIIVKITEKSRLAFFTKKVSETNDIKELLSLCGTMIDYNNIVVSKILEQDNLSFEQLKEIYYVRKSKKFKEIILLKMLDGAETIEDLLWIIKVSKNNSAIREKANYLFSSKA